jgi:hypothetical protein
MKISLVMIFVAFLSGCSADTSSNTEPDKEPTMIGKNSTQTYVIFSPMQGLLLQDGKPLSHTKIIRRLRWNGNDEEGLVEEFVSDDQGRFSLPVHEEQLSIGMLGQFVAKAYLEVELGSDVKEFWYSTKFEPEIYAETNGPLQGLVCDITTERSTLRVGLSKIYTNCRWDNIQNN